MKLRTAITTATTAAVLATSGVALAGAASPSAPASSPSVSSSTEGPNASAHPARHQRARRHRIRTLVRKVVTETIGIDRAALRRELRTGKTIAEIATANGVEPVAVVDALVTAATAKLDAAAAAGKITAERAQKIEARLPARFSKLVDTWHPRHLRDANAEARQ